MITLLSTARSYLGLTLEGAQEALGQGARPVPGDEYGRMQNVISIENREIFPGTLYLENGTVQLVRVGVDDLAGFTATALRRHCGDGAVRLRSRAGKHANLWVYAKQGIAFSTQGETIHFLEVFLPYPQREYEARIYKEHSPFIR
jgi:hypothetical protein